ncbi:MAG TPA: PAS domain S-box protein [Spirochaetota bacterium]|nr:PAS domain S-box protein [Spirochaetota bacterium]
MSAGISYRLRLLLWIMPTLAAGLLALSAGAYWYTKDIIQDELTRSMLSATGKSAENINIWLRTLILEPETIAATPAAKNINRDFHTLDIQNINRYKVLHKKYPDIFQDIYAANRKGVYHTVQQDGDRFSFFVGDISNRGYFRSIMSGGPAQITVPLISRTTGIPTIFAVAPIRDENERAQGLIGIGISLDYVEKVAESLRFGSTGYGIVLSSDGTVIFHPDRSLNLKKNVFELEGESVNMLGKLMIAGGSGVHHYTYNNRREVAFYHAVPVTGWSVASVISEAELFSPARQMLRTLFFITAAIIALIGTIIILVSRRLASPLQKLALHAREVASGNLDVPPLVIQSGDEIGTLAHAFNEMIVRLRDTMDGLKKSEEKYRGIFENAGEGIFQSSFSGQNLNANPAMLKILGYESPDELFSPGFNIKEKLYVIPEERDLFVSQMKKNGFINRFEIQFYRRDGEKIWVSLSAHVARDYEGGFDFIEGVCLDITERKHAEIKLMESEEKFRSLVENLNIGVYRFSGGRFIQANRAMLNIFGYDKMEDLQKTAFEDLFMDAAERDRLMDKLRLDGFVKDLEVVMKKNTGKEIWCSVTANLHSDRDNKNVASDGSIEWFDGVLEDITERKNTEDEKKRLEVQLRQVQKMEAVGQLAGGIAHDFNNVLTAIIGYGNLLSRRITGGDEKSEKYINEMLSAADRAANLTKGLLAFSRKQVMEPEPLRINEIVQKMMKLLSMLLTEDIAMETFLTEADPVVMADVTQIDQVLLNLVTNARDAMPGGGKLVIETRLAEIDDAFISMHGFGTKGHYALLSVSDTGAGMSAEIRDKIFDPFFTTKDIGKGTGLGLAIVYGIVKQHEGFISLYSEEGHGTRFLIYIPVINSGTEEKYVQPLEVTGGSETILIAEDNAGPRSLIKEILTGEGYTVMEAEDGEMAVSMFRENCNNLDLVVMDVVMPEKNGFDAYREISSIKPDVKVLFMSGYTGEIILDKGLNENEFNFISKPFSPTQLLIKIREIFDS